MKAGGAAQEKMEIAKKKKKKKKKMVTGGNQCKGDNSSIFLKTEPKVVPLASLISLLQAAEEDTRHTIIYKVSQPLLWSLRLYIVRVRFVWPIRRGKQLISKLTVIKNKEEEENKEELRNMNLYK